MLKVSRYSRLAEMTIQRQLGKGDFGGGALPSSASPSWVGNLKKLVRHGLVYRLGALYPLKQAPQTLIVIAVPN